MPSWHDVDQVVVLLRHFAPSWREVADSAPHSSHNNKPSILSRHSICPLYKMTDRWIDRSVLSRYVFNLLVFSILVFISLGFSNVGFSVVGFTVVGFSNDGFSNDGKGNTGTYDL